MFLGWLVATSRSSRDIAHARYQIPSTDFIVVGGQVTYASLLVFDLSISLANMFCDCCTQSVCNFAVLLRTKFPVVQVSYERKLKNIRQRRQIGIQQHETKVLRRNYIGYLPLSLSLTGIVWK
jgi:hypothetical protein